MNAGAILSTLNHDMREHIASEHECSLPWSIDLGCLDAPVHIAAGACMQLSGPPYTFPAQQVVYRDLLDAYDANVGVPA